MNDLIKLYLPNLVMVVGVLVGTQLLVAGPAERRAHPSTTLRSDSTV